MSKIYLIAIGLAVVFLLYRLMTKKDKAKQTPYLSYNSHQPTSYLQQHAYLLQQQSIQKRANEIRDTQQQGMANHQLNNNHQMKYNDSNKVYDDYSLKDCAAALICAYFGAPTFIREQGHVTSSTMVSDFDGGNDINTRQNTYSSSSNGSQSSKGTSNNQSASQYRIGKGGRRIYKRTKLGERIRKVVASEQQWRCNNCDNLLPPNFEIDHLKAVCEGGTNDRENLQALCRACHGIKTTTDGLRVKF
jgi:5-methylcytosine-specific restriction endonuclease McrA